MLPATKTAVSFSDVAFKGTFGRVLVTVLVLLVALIVAYGALQGMAPANYAGTTDATGSDFAIEVKDTSEQPLRVYISHTFHLVTTPGSNSFDLADGEAWFVFYNLSVRNSEGNNVFDQSSSFFAPFEHDFSRSASSDTELKEDKYDVYLPPGVYSVQVGTDHPVDYRMEQAFKYQAAANGLLALWFIAVVILVVLVYLAVKKQSRLNRSAMIAAMSTVPGAALYPSPTPAYEPAAFAVPVVPVQPPVQQYGTPAIQYPAYGAGAGMYQGGYQYAPVYPPPSPAQDPATTSNLQPAPSGFYAEVVCTACGRTIRNPPVYGVVTCEHCGEQGRI